MMTTTHHLAPEDIADELGDIKAQARDLEQRRSKLIAELGRRHMTRARGHRFEAIMTHTELLVLDTAMLKTKLGLTAYTALCRPSPRDTWRCVAVVDLAA